MSGLSQRFRVDYDNPQAPTPRSPSEAKKRAAQERKKDRDARLARIRAQRKPR